MENPADILRARTLRAKTFRSFIPIIILPVMLMGLFSYAVASVQLRKNMYSNITDVVLQTKNYMDNSMTLIFEQLIQFGNNSDMMNVIGSFQYGKPLNKPSLYLKADNSLGKICGSYHNMVESVYLNINDGDFMIALKGDGIASIFQNKISFSQWADTYNCSQPGYYWLNIHQDIVFQDAKKVTSLFWIFGKPDALVKGVLLFNLKEEFFKQVLGSDSFGKNGYITILSSDGQMCFEKYDPEYSIDNAITGKILNTAAMSGKFETTNKDGQDLFIVYDTMKINGWKVIVVVPESEIMSNLNYIMYFTILIMFLLIIVAIVASNHLSGTITQSLSKLTLKVKEVEEGNLDTDFNIETETEVGVLNKGIKDLIIRIKELIKQIEEEHRKEREAEIKALQAQINPHFLYNTLDSAKHLCEMGANKEAGNIISYISNFYRIGISNGREVISIAEEIEHVRSYLLAQHMQYGEQFDYEFRISSDILNGSIIKIILQPLVENAIYHGVKKKRIKGKILILGFKKDDRVFFKVNDDGAGISQERLEQISKCLKGIGGHEFSTCTYGIWNVHERLQLKYGKEYGLVIESIKGEYTDVTVCIPFEE